MNPEDDSFKPRIRPEKPFPTQEGGGGIGVQPLQLGTGAVPIRDRIRKAYFDFTGGKTNEPVALIDIRGRMKDIPRDILDKELIKLQKEEGHNLTSWENPRTIYPGMKEGALRYAGEDLHLLTINPTKHSTFNPLTGTLEPTVRNFNPKTGKLDGP